jgi:hypothetical protein
LAGGSLSLRLLQSSVTRLGSTKSLVVVLMVGDVLAK